MPNNSPPYPEHVIFIRLTGATPLSDMTTLVGSGTVIGGGQPGVYGVTSPAQLDLLRQHNISFEIVEPAKGA